MVVKVGHMKQGDLSTTRAAEAEWVEVRASIVAMKHP